MTARPLKLWLIDDEDFEFFIVDRALRKQEDWRIELRYFISARAAVASLQTIPAEEMPDVILCDIKMPELTGFDFLQWLRGSKYRSIPVLIRSNSAQQPDIDRAYTLGASAYHEKPASNEALGKRLKAIVEYWATCERPDRSLIASQLDQ